MNSTLLYRIAAVLLVLFAVGHTLGFMTFKPHSTEGMAVREAMTTVHFEFRGKEYSYGNFYRGFGLTVTAYLLFSAFLAWYLGDVAARAPAVMVSPARGIRRCTNGVPRTERVVLLSRSGLVFRSHCDLPRLGGVVGQCDRCLTAASCARRGYCT